MTDVEHPRHVLHHETKMCCRLSELRYFVAASKKLCKKIMLKILMLQVFPLLHLNDLEVHTCKLYKMWAYLIPYSQHWSWEVGGSENYCFHTKDA